LQSFSSKLAHLFIEEVAFYLYPSSAAIIGTPNSRDAIAERQLKPMWANFSTNAYSSL
jgi:hypothetical protein